MYFFFFSITVQSSVTSILLFKHRDVRDHRQEKVTQNIPEATLNDVELL